jgi:hypothetical protein
LLVATDLELTDGRSQAPIYFTCAGGATGGGSVQESGIIRFLLPTPAAGDNAVLPRALRVRTASRLRIDQIPIDLHDLAAR